MDATVAAAMRDIFRVGEVTEVDAEKCTARVTFPDTDDAVSVPLVVAQRKTHKDKDFWMPDVGEMVACLFLATGPIAGFIMFAIYNEIDIPPVTDPDKRHIQYEDETVFEYDRKEHKLTVELKGDAVINIEGEDGGEVAVAVKKGVTITTEAAVVIGAEEDITITAEGNIGIDATGNINIMSTGNTKLSPTGTFEISKQTPATPAQGPLNCLSNCLFAGPLHGGNTVA